jgi:hypothetical protein
MISSYETGRSRDSSRHVALDTPPKIRLKLDAALRSPKTICATTTAAAIMDDGSAGAESARACMGDRRSASASWMIRCFLGVVRMHAIDQHAACGHAVAQGAAAACAAVLACSGYGWALSSFLEDVADGCTVSRSTNSQGVIQTDAS